MTGETVLLASFMHETNTFVVTPATTTRDDFRDRREYFGDDLVEPLRGTETSVGGAIAVSDREGIDLRPVLAASATPGAPVEQSTYEFYVDAIVDGVRDHADDLDAVMLPLHGAMVPEEGQDGEGPLVARIREVVGPDVPIALALDLHANVTSEMMEHTDVLVGYKEYPHLDKAATGRLAMDALIETVRGEVEPTMHLERPPQLLFQPKADTRTAPMAPVMEHARDHEERDGVLAVSVFVGYYHADVPEMGVTIPVVTDDDPALAREVSRDLAETLWDRRSSFVETYPGPEEAVAEAKAQAERLDDDAGPVVVADFGSNPGGGGASDGTTISRAMLDQDVDDAGYAIMYDPAVVDQCLSAGVGSTLTITLGGKTDDNHGAPLEELEAYVTAITDGRYVNTGTSHSGHGVQNDLGPTVHLACGPDRELHVVVAGTRESAFDAEVWRHIGIQPERLGVLCVPSFIAFLGDYEPFSGGVVLADTPGVSAVDPVRFEYERIPRPLYPLDDLPDDRYPTW